MAALDQKSPNVLLQNLCCKITGKSEADVAHQFQYAVRVIGSNYAPTIERDEFLVSEKIKKELLKQRREADAALFSELHRKLQTQGVLKHRWSILYLLLSLCEDPRKPSNRVPVCSYGALLAQALPRDVHSTPFYYARPQSLPLSYPERSATAHNSSIATSGISSMGVFSINGPGPTPPSLLTGPGPQAVGESMRGSRLAWTLPISSSPSGAAAAPRPPSGPSSSPASKLPQRQRRDGDGSDGKFIKMCSPENCYKIDSKVLLIGKSINFLHQVCHDRTPPGKIMPASKSTDSPKDAVELFTDLEGAFQSNIDAAYFETSKYLLDVLNKNYQLLEHLQAMRRYLLLGQGDFIRHLMDLLKPELVRAATTLYQHNLTGILETAVRATNAQFDSPEILKRLDVRLLEVSPGDTGWHVFSLDYHVEGPIATVFTRECMSHYLRVFNFLWRAKRMEYILTDIWKGQMCNAKLLKSMPELSGVLHQCHVLASEMVHFIHQMQYYITFEVLECSWDELWNKVQQAQDLDHIIAAHDVFLDSIISRCLLDVNNRSLLNQLRAVFDQIIEFQNAQDTLYRSALEELQLRIQFEDKKRQREEMGEWGVTAEQEAEENRRVQEFKDTIPKMCSQLRLLTHFYQGIVQEFLRLLMTDESLQFLSFRLDFNEHYKARDPRLRPSLGATRGRRSSNI
ncbi:gamma-tubulin complex component 3 homolog [Sinocyclocheilus grahami]|uniref:gamma-tubulin complex component 3 homolog n=1 Tax=Sinocyclocheilus grahami TaxID=75366 RepID=UPI0007AD497F|nr:PREDICTED: gamma-tubulin complex component 3 homolog [Sinocyclocheilus grahami]